MFVQINVVKNSEVELVPRVGNHIVLLGGVDRYEQKLEKLNKFYTEGLGYDSWNKYKVINLKYENQVVCSK
jgi:cell division protein FtsQ